MLPARLTRAAGKEADAPTTVASSVCQRLIVRVSFFIYTPPRVSRPKQLRSLVFRYLPSLPSGGTSGKPSSRSGGRLSCALNKFALHQCRRQSTSVVVHTTLCPTASGNSERKVLFLATDSLAESSGSDPMLSFPPVWLRAWQLLGLWTQESAELPKCTPNPKPHSAIRYVGKGLCS